MSDSPESSVDSVEISPVPCDAVHYSCHPDLVAVRYEYLTEVIARHHLQKIGNAVHVKFVEYIVQQQYRCKPVILLHYLVLGELKGHKERLLLSLGAIAPDRMSVHSEDEIVPLET